MITPTTNHLDMARSTTDDRRWLQVTSRAPEADGRFVYAVSTTGIYCRPTCPSRRPLRHHVRFFSAPPQAERAGFRACRRCVPTAERRESAATHAVVKAASYLRTHATDTIVLADVAAHVGLSASHLQRVFTKHAGVSPREYHAACRADEFRRALREGSDVTRATYEAGYGSPSRVSAQRPTGLGLTPGAYRRGGAGETIRYELTRSTLGQLLIAATPRGVCAVKLGSTATALVAELASEFPAAERVAGGLPAAWVEAVSAIVAGHTQPSDLPLDVRGTAFQYTVWQALCAIPAGQTVTYAQLAANVGRPSAARAVARACATNRLAVVVPCHRVVPSTGGEGGYRWGVERKTALLKREASEGRSDR